MTLKSLLQFMLYLSVFGVNYFALGDQAVEQAFRRSKIVPDIIQQPPSDFLEVTYRNPTRHLNLGNEIAPNYTRDAPEIHFEADWGGYYTLMMLDIDAPRYKNPVLRSFINWLVVNIYEADGTTIMEYVGAAPPKFTDRHRYVFLVFKQPERLNFDESYLDAREAAARGYFSVKRFADKYNLGNPVAGNYFMAEYDDSVPSLLRQFRS